MVLKIVLTKYKYHLVVTIRWNSLSIIILRVTSNIPFDTKLMSEMGKLG